MIIFCLCGLFTFPNQYQHSRKAQVRTNTDGYVSVQGDFSFPLHCGLVFTKSNFFPGQMIGQLILFRFKKVCKRKIKSTFLHLRAAKQHYVWCCCCSCCCSCMTFPVQCLPITAKSQSVASLKYAGTQVMRAIWPCVLQVDANIPLKWGF